MSDWSEGHNEVEIDIEIEIDDIPYRVVFDRCFDIVKDSNYGADADGNRGIVAYFVEDDRYENVQVEIDADVLEDLDDVESPGLKEKIEAALDNWLSENEA